jgi:hypothetical protein
VSLKVFIWRLCCLQRTIVLLIIIALSVSTFP